MKISIWLSTLACLTIYADGAKILGLFPLPRESHFLMYEKLMKGLLAKGHEVDVVSYFPQKKKIPRYTDIDLRNNTTVETFNLTVEVVEDYGMWPTATYIFRQYGANMCDKILKNPAAVKLAQSDTKYDIIISEIYGSDCMLGFAYLFKTPIIGIMGDELVPWATDRMGNPDNPSYIPCYLMPYGSKMSLQSRVLNAFTGFAFRVGYQFLSLIPSELRARELFGPDLTPIDVLAYNTSLVLVNSHFSINFPRPMVPGIIEVAGLHIENEKPLPAKLNKYTKYPGILIYVVIQSEIFTTEKIQSIIKPLSTYSNPVIWRGPRSDIGELPQNFYVDDFELEKIDVLCNENTGVLITNGDVFVLQEAVHCGIPVIGIPLIADHEIYVRDFVRRGLAIQVAYQSLIKDDIYQAMDEMLKNTTYKTNAKKYSVIFRDRPQKPLNQAIYWIEYVLRHGGAKHLRTIGADLIWMEYYNIDITLVFIGIAFVLFAIAGFLYYLFYKYMKQKRDAEALSKKEE